MRKALVPAVGCVASHGPTDRVVRRGFGPAPIVDAGVHAIEAGLQAIEFGQVVVPTERPAFAAGAIVGEEGEDRVVQDAALLQVRDEPAHLMVGMAQEAGRDLHLSLEQGFLSIVVLVPPAYARVGLWQDRAFRHHTQLLLALERLGTDDIPAGTERAAVRLP